MEAPPSPESVPPPAPGSSPAPEPTPDPTPSTDSGSGLLFNLGAFWGIKDALASSTAPALISKVIFTSSFDPKTNQITAATTFAPSVKKIFGVLRLKPTARPMRLEYVRYRNDRFVDYRSLNLAKPGTTQAAFVWTDKPNKIRPKGTYVVKFYLDGQYQTKAQYRVE
jgi:hypothetical protein